MTSSWAEFEVEIPSELDGDFESPAPENYYSVALTNCFVATFKVIADNSDVSFEEFRADGTLRLRPDGKTTVVDSFELDVELHTDVAERQTKVLLERTEGKRFILSSVDFPVTVNTEIVSS